MNTEYKIPHSTRNAKAARTVQDLKTDIGQISKDMLSSKHRTTMQKALPHRCTYRRSNEMDVDGGRNRQKRMAQGVGRRQCDELVGYHGIAP